MDDLANGGEYEEATGLTNTEDYRRSSKEGMEDKTPCLAPR